MSEQQPLRVIEIQSDLINDCSLTNASDSEHAWLLSPSLEVEQESPCDGMFFFPET